MKKPFKKTPPGSYSSIPPLFQTTKPRLFWGPSDDKLVRLKNFRPTKLELPLLLGKKFFQASYPHCLECQEVSILCGEFRHVAPKNQSQSPKVSPRLRANPPGKNPTQGIQPWIVGSQSWKISKKPHVFCHGVFQIKSCKTSKSQAWIQKFVSHHPILLFSCFVHSNRYISTLLLACI